IYISSIIQFDNIKSLKRYSVFYPPVMECLDRNLHTRRLKNGIGNYWDAKYFTMLSRYNLKITQVRDKDILLYHWISNFEWYKRFPPNFIILNTKMSDPHLFIEEDVIKKFGYPNDRFECLNRIVLIYDNLNSTLGTYINKLYLENLKDVDNFSIFKNKSDHCFPKLTASSQLDSFSPDGLLQAIQPGWHSARNPKYPQTITIDFGKTQSIEKIGILPQDQNEKRMPRIIEIRTSDNEKNWVSSGLFDDLCLSGDQDRGDWRIIKFPVPVNGRYLQIKILANCGDPALLTFRGLRVN
ncbi:MAG: discoidin domain-containing protein, partial [Candidatus Competibacteraceae bacterium]|nr:discoidin domain-containing protein [Candidatus Competibacteraceae bacterium]